MAANNTAARVLELARGEVGTTSGEKYVRYYNEITGIGLPLDCSWCAAWVTWVMRHAGVPTDSVLNYKGCSTGVDWFAARGRFYGRGTGYTPKPGDIVMYEWRPENNGTAYDDGADHTGIVEWVEDGKIHTIEGNNGGTCCRDWWSVWHEYIEGYCVPLYNMETTENKEDDAMLTYEQWLEYQQRYEKEKSAKSVSTWAQEAVDYCTEHSLMNGDKDGKFRPQSAITRQEAAQVAMNIHKSLKAE